ncbi:hypothetical protein ACQP00_20970 [Dactylosporangium sp. CS-047395]|uniref:hypothetical protein n=1 Tax=Dactylosporangium sp. CS-047395 TaxID=3239936 RepID=UPI003D90CA85
MTAATTTSTASLINALRDAPARTEYVSSPMYATGDPDASAVTVAAMAGFAGTFVALAGLVPAAVVPSRVGR